MLVAVLAGGTAGYVVIEGWNVWDAFYMTVTTVATVGYREVHPLSLPGQVFTIVLIFCGVGTAFYTVTLLATIIVEGGLHRRLEERRAARMLENLKDHFILCGYGRIGSIIANELHQQGMQVAVIERDPPPITTVSAQRRTCMRVVALLKQPSTTVVATDVSSGLLERILRAMNGPASIGSSPRTASTKCEVVS